MDFESITADIRSAEDTSRNNMARIAQSRAILKRAGETLERIRRRHFPAGDSNPLPQRHTT